MKKHMKLNQEANRLWLQQFGKKQKAIDYSGREIMKAAYNDKNSNYGWNIDHILPQSRGGKTTDYNLVCCHILTNDEKADKFPCFTAVFLSELFGTKCIFADKNSMGYFNYSNFAHRF